MDPPRSRTVWLAVHEGRLFIVSGYMNSVLALSGSKGPHYLEDDDRIILRMMAIYMTATRKDHGRP
ncbi:MAG: hypothetical protein CM1200mP40_03600 [Gammaproteobacteria bacterium]|nr:MAG: hypothetical protein CM1200mP40_03600 [Gammaproteobacteria bacterium]